MQELELVHFWMLGVMGVMLIFFFAAIFGHFYNRSNSHNSNHDKYRQDKKLI